MFLLAAEFLYKFCKKKQQEETKTPMDDLESQSSGSNQPASDFSDQPEGENEGEEQPGETDSYGGTAEQEQQPTSMVVKPMRNLKSKLWSHLRKHSRTWLITMVLRMFIWNFLNLT
jgi:hypothetical protein